MSLISITSPKNIYADYNSPIYIEWNDLANAQASYEVQYKMRYDANWSTTGKIYAPEDRKFSLNQIYHNIERQFTEIYLKLVVYFDKEDSETGSHFGGFEQSEIMCVIFHGKHTYDLKIFDGEIVTIYALFEDSPDSQTEKMTIFTGEKEYLPLVETDSSLASNAKMQTDIGLKSFATLNYSSSTGEPEFKYYEYSPVYGEVNNYINEPVHHYESYNEPHYTFNRVYKYDGYYSYGNIYSPKEVYSIYPVSQIGDAKVMDVYYKTYGSESYIAEQTNYVYSPTYNYETIEKYYIPFYLTLYRDYQYSYNDPATGSYIHTYNYSYNEQRYEQTAYYPISSYRSYLSGTTTKTEYSKYYYGYYNKVSYPVQYTSFFYYLEPHYSYKAVQDPNSRVSGAYYTYDYAPKSSDYYQVTYYKPKTGMSNYYYGYYKWSYRIGGTGVLVYGYTSYSATCAPYYYNYGSYAVKYTTMFSELVFKYYYTYYYESYKDSDISVYDYKKTGYKYNYKYVLAYDKAAYNAITTTINLYNYEPVYTTAYNTRSYNVPISGTTSETISYSYLKPAQGIKYESYTEPVYQYSFTYSYINGYSTSPVGYYYNRYNYKNVETGYAVRQETYNTYYYKYYLSGYDYYISGKDNYLAGYYSYFDSIAYYNDYYVEKYKYSYTTYNTYNEYYTYYN